MDDLVHNRGHRALRITRKGGKVGRSLWPPVTSRALDTYLGGRTTGPNFLNGTARLSYARRTSSCALARMAGIPRTDSVHPHNFGHTLATEALDAGAAEVSDRRWI